MNIKTSLLICGIITLLLMISPVEAVCSTTCYIDDDASGDYNIDHSNDQIEINAAITAVAANSSVGTPGTVILNYTSIAYNISDQIMFNRSDDYITLKGENLNVSIQTAVGTVFDSSIRVKSNHTNIMNLTINGGRSNNTWCGGCGIKREVMFDYDVDPSPHDIYVENITVTNSPDDGFWGRAKNVSLNNIACDDIGHSCVLAMYGDTTSDADNWSIDGISCLNTGNACVRDMSLNGLTVRNMYTDSDANFGIEIWPGDSTFYFSQNMLFENITIVSPPLAGIMMYAHLVNSQWHIMNLTFNNVLIDCTVAGSCQTYVGANNMGSAVYATNATNLTFNNFTIVKAKDNGFNFSNDFTINSNITIKNSIVSESEDYAVKNIQGNFTWDIHHNDFWNNTLGNTSGSVTIGSDMLYENPLFVSASDFHLQASSPVIGMAENGEDMGMYQYESGIEYAKTDLYSVYINDSFVANTTNLSYINDAEPGECFDIGIIAVNTTYNTVSAMVNETSCIAVGLFVPPTPVSLSNTTGNYWVNYTWSAGSGNITNLYNVSITNNSIQSWRNGTSTTFLNSTLAAGQWSNISVYAYNSSSTGTLNATPTIMNTKLADAINTIPNPIMSVAYTKSTTWINLTWSPDQP